MKCKVDFKELSKYVDGVCTQREKEKIDSHIKECADCKKLLNGLCLMKGALGNLAPVQESQNFDFEFNQKLKQRIPEKAPIPVFNLRDLFTPRVPALVRAAVSFVLLMAVLFGGYNYYIYSQLPVIENISGQAQIYKPKTDAWVLAKVNMRLKEGYRIKTKQGALVDILSKGKYAARIKDSANIILAKLNISKPDHSTEFSITNGKLLVNTRKGFKGSSMLISTPTCKAKVIGTAFAVNVDKHAKGSTWLGVLEGKVQVFSEGKAVFVNSGQKTLVVPEAVPALPTLLSDTEWDLIHELYQLGEKPQVALLISIRENRVEELLKPAPLYILDIAPRTIPMDLEAIINLINKAIEDDSAGLHEFALERLQALVREHPNPRYSPQFLMFIGAYQHYIENYKDAIETFQQVIDKYPDYMLSSLAQRAIVEIYRNVIKDEKRAQQAIKQLIEIYPNSLDSKKFME